MIRQISYSLLAFIIFIIVSGCASLSKNPDPANNSSHYFRDNKNNSNVIIFVHGFGGDSESTWKNPQANKSWPEIMSEDPDFNDANIYMVNYYSPLYAEADPIETVVRKMGKEFERDDVTKHKKLIFLSHSMGGIVTREYLINSEESAAKTPVTYFLATPTTGTQLAALSIVSHNPQLSTLKAMELGNALAKQQNGWLSKKYKIKSFCAVETKSTDGVLVVDQGSATNLCTEPIKGIAENHINIVKPFDKNSDSYTEFKNAYREAKRVVVDKMEVLAPESKIFDGTYAYSASNGHHLLEFPEGWNVKKNHDHCAIEATNQCLFCPSNAIVCLNVFGSVYGKDSRALKSIADKQLDLFKENSGEFKLEAERKEFFNGFDSIKQTFERTPNMATPYETKCEAVFMQTDSRVTAISYCAPSKYYSRFTDDFNRILSSYRFVSH